MFKACIKFDIVSMYEASFPKDQARHFWNSIGVLLVDQQQAENQQLPELSILQASILLTMWALKDVSGRGVKLSNVAKQLSATNPTILHIYIYNLVNLGIIGFNNHFNLEFQLAISAPAQAILPQKVSTNNKIAETETAAMNSSSLMKRGNNEMTLESKTVDTIIAEKDARIKLLEKDNSKLKNKLTKELLDRVNVLAENRRLVKENNKLKAENDNLNRLHQMNNATIKIYEGIRMFSPSPQPQALRTLTPAPQLQSKQSASRVTSISPPPRLGLQPQPVHGPFFVLPVSSNVNNENNINSNNTGKSGSIGFSNQSQS